MNEVICSHISLLQNHTTATRRTCNMKALVVYLNEDPDELIKEYLVSESVSLTIELAD